ANTSRWPLWGPSSAPAVGPVRTTVPSGAAATDSHWSTTSVPNCCVQSTEPGSRTSTATESFFAGSLALTTVTVVAPAATPTTSAETPEPVTAATSGSALYQVRPAAAPAGETWAESRTEPPTASRRSPPSIVTDSTAGGGPWLGQPVSHTAARSAPATPAVRPGTLTLG